MTVPITEVQLSKRPAGSLLAGGAVLLCALIGAIVIWAVLLIATQIENAIAPAPVSSQAVQFDVNAASRIDYRTSF